MIQKGKNPNYLDHTNQGYFDPNYGRSSRTNTSMVGVEELVQKSQCSSNVVSHKRTSLHDNGGRDLGE